MIKLFNENSNNLNELKPDFLPIASHLINFISYWVSTNSGYGYDVVCTKRSWHSQKHITTIEDDRKNGLSWYLYGNAISINVFQKITDNIVDNESSTEWLALHGPKGDRSHNRREMESTHNNDDYDTVADV